MTCSPQELPLGRAKVAVRLEPTGEGTAAVVTLRVDDDVVATSQLAETFEHFVAFQGLDVGGDRFSPTRENGVGEFTFTGGLDRVVVELLDGGPGRGHQVAD